MILCKMCDTLCKNSKGLGSHITKYHHISSKQYYDTYIESFNHFCIVCNKPTKFLGLNTGYAIHCSNRCAQKDPKTIEKSHKTKLIKYGDPTFTNRQKAINTMINKYGVENISQKEGFGDKVKQTKLKNHGDSNYNNRTKAKETCLKRYNTENPYQIEQIKEKAYNNNYTTDSIAKKSNTIDNNIKDFETKNNCTQLKKLIKLYGQGFLNIKRELKQYHYKSYTFIDNNDIYKIEEYNKHLHGTSKLEQDIYIFIKSIYKDKIIRRSKSIIKPLELDFYLPAINLAIEFNGTYFHSIKYNKDIYYHLNKSLLCREKCIRLIHIYEFEDLTQQKQLLKDLILGIDNYPKNDFNKNNLINIIPKPEIIYKDRFIIYGAGKLF